MAKDIDVRIVTKKDVKSSRPIVEIRPHLKGGLISDGTKHDIAVIDYIEELEGYCDFLQLKMYQIEKIAHPINDWG